MTGVHLDTRPRALLALAAEAAADAEARGDLGLINTLRTAADPWDDVTAVTVYTDGVWDTNDGTTYAIRWSDLGNEMARYACEIVLKGEGIWFTPAVSSNGRCRDADIAAITQLSFDADGAGDWNTGLMRLDSAGIAHIASRSSSHQPTRPKFHLHIPLARHWSGEKAEWRQMYRFCVSWFSVLFDLDRNLGQVPAIYGFDHATDRLGQPWFLSARRTETAPVPEVRVVHGDALDLELLLDLCGFVPKARETTRPQRRSTRNVYAPVEAGRGCFLFERAFAHAGWLGRTLANGARVVRCPWEDAHSAGAPFDGSSVIFPPQSRRGNGVFVCLHSHCRDRTAQEVMLALPPDAFRRALMGELRVQ